MTKFHSSFATTARCCATATMAAALLLTAASTASAQYTVDRTQIRLSGRAQSAILKLTNQSPQPIRFDVKIFSWDQDANGQDQLTATNDAIAAPGSIALGAGESQNIRIGTTAALGAQEKTYRLIIEELPAPRQASGATVAMRTRLSIPVFLAPTRGQATLQIDAPTMIAGLPSVVARNTGTVHLQVDSLTFRGVGANGQTAFEVTGGGTYILPGKGFALRASAAVPAAQCRAATKIVASAVFNGDAVTHEAPLTAANCGQ
jgi:fimbrial chaperone protein